MCLWILRFWHFLPPWHACAFVSVSRMFACLLHAGHYPWYSFGCWVWIKLHTLCFHNQTHGWGWLLECYRLGSGSGCMFPCPGVTSASWPHGCLSKWGVLPSLLTFFSLCLFCFLSPCFFSNHSVSSGNGFKKVFGGGWGRMRGRGCWVWEKEHYGCCEHLLFCSHHNLPPCF